MKQFLSKDFHACSSYHCYEPFQTLQSPRARGQVKAAAKSLFKSTYNIVKLVDGQIFVSIREFRFWQLTDMVIGLVIMVIAMVQI